VVVVSGFFCYYLKFCQNCGRHICYCCCFCFVVVVVVIDVVVCVVVYPRNLPLKFGQNQVSNI